VLTSHHATTQSFGLLVGSTLVAIEVVNGTKQTSDFIFFITYLAQVYGPLNNLGYIYRSLNQALVDTERLFKLLDESKDVIDKPDAKDLVITNGEIEFRK
jgi:ATP-binding cassette subfamily B (MDR/TAP) protein 6